MEDTPDAPAGSWPRPGRAVRVERASRWARRLPAVVEPFADAGFAAVLAALLAPGTIALTWRSDWPAGGRTAFAALVAVLHLSVASRRARPRAAFAVCCVAELALVLAPDVVPAVGTGVVAAGEPVAPVLLPSSLVYLVVLHAVAAHARRPWPVAALAVSLAGAVLTTARLARSASRTVNDTPLTGPGPVLLVFASLVAAVLAAWGLGRYRALRVAYVAALEERARRAEQDRLERAAHAVAAERARIAREMHDIVAHSLAVIVRQAEGGRFAAAKDPAVAVRTLTVVADAGREALADMRAMLAALREAPAPADDAPQPAVGDVPALVDRVRAAGLPVRLTVTGTPVSLDRAASLAAYRLVQEALTNVVKHAGPAATAQAALAWSSRGLDVTVTDTGAAVPAAPRGPGDGGPGDRGQGLIGMRERVVLAGGWLRAGPDAGPGADALAGADGDGFAVRAWLPARTGTGEGTA